MKKKNLTLWICIVALLVLFVLVLWAAGFLAYTISHPEGMTLSEEEQWEKEEDLWGNFDSYETEEYTVEVEDAYIIHAELVRTRPDSGSYVIITHGYGSNRYGCVKYVDAWTSVGYNCIIYDVRGHGENEATSVSLGQFESKDLLCLIQDTYDRYGEGINLGLQGESMGSSISLSVLQYSQDVDFVVADCGFTNLYDLIGTGLSEYNLGWAMPLVNAFMKKLGGYDMKETSAIDAISENSVPIFFIHGEADDLIPSDNSNELYKAAGGYCEIYLVPEAGHAESRKVLGTDGYADILLGFLGNIRIKVPTPHIGDIHVL